MLKVISKRMSFMFLIYSCPWSKNICFYSQDQGPGHTQDQFLGHDQGVEVVGDHLQVVADRTAGQDHVLQQDEEGLIHPDQDQDHTQEVAQGLHTTRAAVEGAGYGLL